LCSRHLVAVESNQPWGCRPPCLGLCIHGLSMRTIRFGRPITSPKSSGWFLLCEVLDSRFSSRKLLCFCFRRLIFPAGPALGDNQQPQAWAARSGSHTGAKSANGKHPVVVLISGCRVLGPVKNNVSSRFQGKTMAYACFFAARQIFSHTRREDLAWPSTAHRGADRNGNSCMCLGKLPAARAEAVLSPWSSSCVCFGEGAMGFGLPPEKLLAFGPCLLFFYSFFSFSVFFFVAYFFLVPFSFFPAPSFVILLR